MATPSLAVFASSALLGGGCDWVTSFPSPVYPAAVLLELVPVSTLGTGMGSVLSSLLSMTRSFVALSEIARRSVDEPAYRKLYHINIHVY